MTATLTINTRAAGAEVLAVDWPDRTIRIIAAPYGEYAPVVYRGQTWREVFRPGAFDSLASINPETVRVNREHSRADAVGKCIAFDTRDPRGLIATIRIARSARGDDTLALAAEDMLSASVGFGVYPDGERLDRFARTREIIHAHLDHLALVQAAAYHGATVLAVRSAIDAYLNDPIYAWARQRTNPVWTWARRRTRRGR